MKIRNVIFDCNGTMIFDGKYHDIAWRTYVSKLAGRELTKEEFQHQILGHTNRDIFEWLLGKGALSEEIKKGFLWRLPIISEKSESSVAFTRMTLPLLSDTAPKLSAGQSVGTAPHLPNLCCEYQSTLICWWKMSSMQKIESEGAIL